MLGLARVEDIAGRIEDEQQIGRRERVAEDGPAHPVRDARPLARCQSRVVWVPVEEREASAQLLDPGRPVAAPHAAEAKDEAKALRPAVVLRSGRVQPEVERPDAERERLRQLVDQV